MTREYPGKEKKYSITIQKRTLMMLHFRVRAQLHLYDRKSIKTCILKGKIQMFHTLHVNSFSIYFYNIIVMLI